ncbi:hypothetical protein PACTADRAFT_2033 [Pachysolen tannophilus NRRL Y-2460]|uniref:Transcription factor domain-containing protein n=1 Tax=Pachysolen tannophilus NRRL Y-2460 TaxID=669874 RepID=A0A1E4U0D9_PACTA|nr:hypothetical protein PACTADRAFT_2033 [Pachysolen tannophilus NRRL Y-2460]
MNCFSQYSRFISLHGLLNICYDLKYRGLFDLGILTKKRLFDLVIRLQHAFLSWKDYFDRHISITNRSECDEVLNDYSASPIFWSNLTIFKIALISLYVDTSTILKYSSNLNDHKLITKIQNWTKSSEGESCVIESCRFLIIVINNVEIIHSVPHVAYCTFLVCLILWSFETNRQISAFNSTNMLTPLTPRKYFDADNNLLIETVGNDATNYLSGILENNNINVENFEEYCTRQQQVIALITYIIGILKENCSWENIGPRIEVLEKVLKTYDE